MTRVQSLMALILWVALCLLTGWTAALLTQPAIPSWYAQLQKPSWTPPNWAFGPVWTLLYVLMGVSAWLVWRRNGFGPARSALAFFLIQLALNFLWSPLFFHWKMPGIAFLDIVLLWCAILATLLAFRHHSPTAAYLLLPYLLWVTYAAALNFALWRLNL